MTKTQFGQSDNLVKPTHQSPGPEYTQVQVADGNHVSEQVRISKYWHNNRLWCHIIIHVCKNANTGIQTIHGINLGKTSRHPTNFPILS